MTHFESAMMPTRHIVSLVLLLTSMLGSASPAAAQRRADAASARPTRLTALPVIPLTLAPAGAKVWWYAGDIQTTMNLAAKGGTRDFSFSVEAVPAACCAVWQVSNRPFPKPGGSAASQVSPTGLVRSGRVEARTGGFTVSFAGLPKLPGLKGANNPWYVRVVPVAGRGNAPVGTPSQAIRVYADSLPPVKPDPNFKLPGAWFTSPGAKVRITSVKFVPLRVDNTWPDGCKVFRGGNQSDPLEWFVGAILDAFDWASTAYADIKAYVVSGIATFLPFVPKEFVALAIDAALASAGIPPNIPNLDQLMTQGADYLANQMADELAAQVPAGHALAQLGKEELRKRMRDEARKAILTNAHKARDALADKSEYCTTMVWDPFFEVTVRNIGSQVYHNVGIGVTTSSPLFKPYMGFAIDQIAPGESLTVPVEFLSYRDINAVPQNPKSQIDGKTSANWWELYHATPLSFTFRGAHTTTYYAMEKGASPISGPYVVEDGTGVTYTTPKRVWLSQAATLTP